MDELLADVSEFSSHFESGWDFEKKYEKKFGKMLTSLK